MKTLISAGTVLQDPDTARRDSAVVVDAGMIVEIGPTDDLVARHQDARVLDHGSGVVVPGLINAHVHLAFDETGDIAAVAEQDDDVALALAMAGRAQKLLQCGTTTARDVGDRGSLAVRLREATAAGALVGPRLLSAGAPLTPPGGHCWFLGGEVEPDDHGALRAAVDRQVEAGVDLVKVMASGGGTTRGGAAMWQPQFGFDELGVVVDQARRRGVPVAAHAHDLDGIDAAVRAGVSTVEHCTWMSGGMQQFASRDLARPVVERMVEQGTVVCHAHPNRWEFFSMVHGEVAADELMNKIRWLADCGVRLIHGTDAGLARFDDSTEALIRLADRGFTGSELLAMATTDAAAGLGLTDTGRLEVGRRADLLVLDRDPRWDITALRELQLVMAGGRTAQPGRSSPTEVEIPGKLRRVVSDAVSERSAGAARPPTSDGGTG